MVTFGDLAKPYEQMPEEAKACFMEAMELTQIDQDELLRKAKEVK